MSDLLTDAFTHVAAQLARAESCLSPEPGLCVLEGTEKEYWELVIERAVSSSLPDRSFQRGLGVV